jgi:hypothetical protein
MCGIGSVTFSLYQLIGSCGEDRRMVFDVMRAYPWAFWSTVVSPLLVAIVAIIGAVFSSLAGFESLKGRLASSQQSQRIDEGVSKLLSNDSERQTTLRLLESYNEKITAAGKRDATLAAIINQYQQLSRAAALFGQMSHRDPTPDQGKVATEILKILNQHVVRTLVREDLPGKPLVIELQPNSFRVIYPVPMRAPPNLTFKGLPAGVSAEVSDKSEISFTVSFLPASIPVKTFGVFASADL